MTPTKELSPSKGPKQGKQSNLVINQIVIKQPQRKAVDINVWRQALITAESVSGRRVQLYDLYDDMLLDPVLSDAIDKRIMAVTNSNIVFQRDGNAVPEMDDLIDSDEFELALQEIMLSKFWGISLLELDFSTGFAVSSIPRKHINPRLGQILINQSDTTGIPYKEDPFFLEIGSKNNLGLILKLCVYVIFKRGGFGDWAQFAELFGQPFREGVYDSYDEYSRKQLEQALEKAGSSPWVVHPKGTEINFKETNSNPGGVLYKSLNEACDDQILIGVLGQTMTTKNGSSKAQGGVHKEEQSDMNKSDRRFVQRILNRRLLPILESRGFPVKGGWFSFPEAGEKVALKDRIEIDTKLKEIIPIDDQYFYDTYGVPKPQGVQVKKDPKTDPQVDPVKKKPPVKSLRFQALRELVSFFLNPRAGHISQDAGQTQITALGINTNDILRQIAEKMLTGEYAKEQTDPDLLLATGDHLMKALKDNFNGFEDLSSDDQARVNWINRQQNNIYKFGMAKSYDQMRVMRDQILGDNGQIKPFSEFLKDVMVIDDRYNKTWLETEHYDVVRGTVMGAEWMDIEDTKDAAPYLQYVTAGDNRVRPEHRALEGIIEPVDSTFWLQYWMPNGHRCRCSAKRLTARQAEHEGYQSGNTAANSKLAGKVIKDPYWRKNVGKSAILEADDTAYIKSVPGKGAKQLKAVSNYGMKKGEDIMSGKGITMVDRRSKQQFENWWKEQADESGNIETKDYQKIPLKFDQEFARHVLNKGHYDIASEAPAIAKNPDEVWAQIKSSHSFKEEYFKVYVKYFKEKAIILLVDKTGRPETIYEVNDIEDFRRGILLKKK